MTIEVLRTKIHRITVTEANVDYIGSITLDEDLIDAAGLVEGEKVQVLNVNNGNRLETYVIKGPRGSRQVCMNGPAALRVAVGDVVIVISYAQMSLEEARNFRPRIIFPDERTNTLKV
jgi:aspartate 1-decarboxylase